MITIPFILILGLLAFMSSKYIRKHQIFLYVFFTVISIVAFIKYDVPVFKPFVQGFLALALFYLVMMAGALPNKSKGKIALMSVRKEYSILGFIIATPHALHYFIEYLNGEISIPIFGIIAYVIMIPLFITSFRTVRKRMSNRSWRNLQRFAYLTYTALIIHLILNFTLIINIIVYGCIFSVYIVYKFLKVLKLHQK